MKLPMKFPVKLRMMLGCALAGLACLATIAPASAQWPDRAITLTVAFPPGSILDNVARRISVELGKQLSQNVIVENKSGAGGSIAAMSVAHAAPDGYSFLVASSGPAAVNKLIYKKLAYDPEADLTPVVLLGSVPQIVVVKPALPVNTLVELIAYAKERPGKLLLGNSGTGLNGHLATIQLAQMTGIEVTHVPYRGTPPLVNDIKAGQIDGGLPGFSPITTSLKMLAVTSEKRLPAIPNVPTMRETGAADIVTGLWFGLMGPAKLPRPIIDRVNAIVNDYLKSPEAHQLAVNLGMEIMGGSPEDMRNLITEELKRLAPIVKSANISLD